MERERTRLEGRGEIIEKFRRANWTRRREMFPTGRLRLRLSITGCGINHGLLLSNSEKWITFRCQIPITKNHSRLAYLVSRSKVDGNWLSHYRGVELMKLATFCLCETESLRKDDQKSASVSTKTAISKKLGSYFCRVVAF